MTIKDIISKVYHKSGQTKDEGKTYTIGANASNVFIDLKGDGGLKLTLQQWFDYMKKNLNKISTIRNKPGAQPSKQDEIWIDYN